MLGQGTGLVPGIPVIRPVPAIRAARIGEAAALSDLCLRSKAVWGYDASFMALMPAALAVAASDIAAGNVWVAEAEGAVAGVVALAPGASPDEADLDKLFVDPAWLRRGIGGALLSHAVAEAHRRGARRLTILADPNAAGFYEKHAVRRLGDAPSGAVPGRRLPLYEIRLPTAME
jgi:GNAT superfamily N-acetyltransferase